MSTAEELTEKIEGIRDRLYGPERSPRDVDIPGEPEIEDVTPLRRTEAGALSDGYRATDVGNAARFADEAANAARYVPAWKKWIVYRGGYWRIDHGDALVTEIAKAVPRSMFIHAATLHGHERDAMWKWANKSEESRAITAMIKLARGVPGVIVDHRELDRHPWLLNVQNGTLDLRTGELGDHDPDHLITRQAPVTYNPTATAPRWEACLATWQPDPNVRTYLQRLVGSAATGVPVESIVNNVGGGANGKGKFYGACMHVLGPDYCAVPHKSLIVAQRHEQHDTVRARLFGVRMAVAAETEAGDRLDEAKVKELTGGDLLEARRMHEDPWSFAPSHTLFLHTNHRPRILGTDEGIWRRVRLIPWSVTIPENQRDPHLADKLADEASGILNWIVRGARDWHELGLQEPQAVTEATAEYRTEEDHVGRFIAECCHVDPDASIPASDLRATYERWVRTSTDEDPWPAQTIGRQLTQRGFTSRAVGRSRTRTWIGITDNPQNSGGERL